MKVELTPLARGLRRRQTDAERKLWTGLRGSQLGGLKFRRQVPRGPYIADFVCEKALHVVELDGGQHGEVKGMANDEIRTAYFESLGYSVVRFWNPEVLTNPKGVLDTILNIAAARAKTPSPNPLPKGRGLETRENESQ
ncbi:MAG: DNA methyltransferase [Hyphomicrobium sp.]|nr:DNA methyltransferase [Hyphomicrobium sp.]PPC80792.1 MAG: DNA methyltransferase [Hyphomicrobium sp.]